MADRTSSDPVGDGDWAAYYEKTGQRPPRPTLIRALDAFDREGRPKDAMAADLAVSYTHLTLPTIYSV